MILYSERDNHYSHRVRIVLAEKDIACEIREFDIEEAPDDILSVSPYHKLPILVDRDLALYDTSVMMEYLDERFPHPPLLPVYPVARANCRELMLRIDREWCPLVDSIISGKLTKPKEKKTKEELIQELIDHQQSKVLKVARVIVPDATPEDIRNPQDFPELVADTMFNYEDGILSGYLSLQTALRKQSRTENLYQKEHSSL